MNPMQAELYDESGNANSLFIIIGWFLLVLLLNFIFEKLNFSSKTCIRIWALINFAPLVWLATLPNAQFLALFGLGVMLFFSFMMGKAVFEHIGEN